MSEYFNAIEKICLLNMILKFHDEERRKKLNNFVARIVI